MRQRWLWSLWWRWISGVTLSLAFSAVAHAQLADKVADRLWESAKILEDITRAPDGGIPSELLKRAECVAVIPSLTKGAVIFGAQYGRGSVSCRKTGGGWGAPSMIAIGGGGFGFQAGGQSMDLVMLFMTPDSIKSLLRDKVTLGTDIAVVTGPKGRAAAETPASVKAEILTYARSRGLFAGVALKGAVLRPDKNANQSLYKRDIEPKDLLLAPSQPAPEAARKLIEALTRVAS